MDCFQDALDKRYESLEQIRDNLVVNLLKEGKHLDILKHFLQDLMPYTDVFNDAAPFETKVGDHVMVPGIDATSDVTGVAGGRSGLAHWLHVVTPVTPKLRTETSKRRDLALKSVRWVPTAHTQKTWKTANVPCLARVSSLGGSDDPELKHSG